MQEPPEDVMKVAIIALLLTLSPAVLAQNTWAQTTLPQPKPPDLGTSTLPNPTIPKPQITQPARPAQPTVPVQTR